MYKFYIRSIYKILNNVQRNHYKKCDGIHVPPLSALKMCVYASMYDKECIAQ